MKDAKLLSVLLAGLLLGGCAELKELTGNADAPIEERGAVATTGTSTTGSGATAGIPVGQPAQKAATSGTGQAQGVETHALPMSGTGESAAMGTGLSATVGGGGIVGVSPERAALLRDPNNPLSKRIVYFDFDSDAIREEYRGLIEAHAGFLKDNTAARIILQGHTDERGSRDYNLALGQRRSESVKQALTLMGVTGEQIETVSLGEEKPVQEGHDEAAWQQNRRAEIHYLGE